MNWSRRAFGAGAGAGLGLLGCATVPSDSALETAPLYFGRHVIDVPKVLFAEYDAQFMVGIFFGLEFSRLASA